MQVPIEDDDRREEEQLQDEAAESGEETPEIAVAPPRARATAKALTSARTAP